MPAIPIYKITLAVAAIIEDDKKRLLMVREAQADCYGLWNQPAGHVEADEGIAEALLREVKEETGYFNARIEGIAGIYYFVDHAVLRINFRVSLLDQTSGPLADDVLETRWFSRAELVEMSRLGQLRSKRTELAIRDWLDGKDSSPDMIHSIVESTIDRILY